MRHVAVVVPLVCLTSLWCDAKAPPDLQMLTAQAAATVKRIIPGSEAEMQGTTAVVKKRTYSAPDIELHGAIATSTGRKVELPDGYGVMFIIRVQSGPYQGAALSKIPQFDPQHARQIRSFLRGCLRTTTLQEFRQSNTTVVVDILFGQYIDTKMLQRAYAELSRFLAAQLGRSE